MQARKGLTLISCLVFAALSLTPGFAHGAGDSSSGTTTDSSGSAVTVGSGGGSSNVSSVLSGDQSMQQAGTVGSTAQSPGVASILPDTKSGKNSSSSTDRSDKSEGNLFSSVSEGQSCRAP